MYWATGRAESRRRRSVVQVRIYLNKTRCRWVISLPTPFLILSCLPFSSISSPSITHTSSNLSHTFVNSPCCHFGHKTLTKYHNIKNLHFSYLAIHFCCPRHVVSRGSVGVSLGQLESCHGCVIWLTIKLVVIDCNNRVSAVYNSPLFKITISNIKFS